MRGGALNYLKRWPVKNVSGLYKNKKKIKTEDVGKPGKT